MNNIEINKEEVYVSLSSVFTDTLTGISWILALPIRVVAWTILTIRRRRYDPEKITCPGCGYRGERGSNYKTCLIRYTPITGQQRAAIEHSCLRCSAPFYTNLYLDGKQWIGITMQTQAERIKATMARGEL